MDLLDIIVIVLGLVAGWQVIRVYELSEDLNGSETEEVTEQDNKFNSVLVFLGMLGFMAMVVYEFIVYQKYLLPPASSAHGPEIDQLFNVSMVIIGIVFFICHAVMGWFAFKYFNRKDRTATFSTHNNKLELIWTIIPTIVLTGLIFYGLAVWNKVMYLSDNDEETYVVEVYGKQFKWLARYPGEDGKLGTSSFKKITATNTMGIDTEDESSRDDIVTSDLHLAVNKTVQMLFQAQDVIHSAYLPHFRVQMNCVPGMTTQFKFIPTKTTAQMREELDDPDFDYVLICNKICGAAHYTMKMLVVVESEEEYNNWLKGQAVFYVDDNSIEEAPKVSEAVEAEAKSEDSSEEVSEDETT